MTSGTPHYPDDPGRDPEGLNPPRDILDATSIPDEGTFTPGRHTKPEHAEEPPDQPPTSWRAAVPESQPASHSRVTAPAVTTTAGPVSTVVSGSIRTESRPPGTSTTTVPVSAPRPASAA